MAGLASLAAWSSWRQVASGGGLRWLASYAAVAPSNPFVLRTRLVSCVSVHFGVASSRSGVRHSVAGSHGSQDCLKAASARTVTQLIIPYRQPCLTPLSFSSTPTHVSSRTFADASAPGDAIGGAADKKAAGKHRGFEDARAYVRTLGLKSVKEWQAWRASGARPRDIPSAPDKMYASTGWTSYGDFLGYKIGKVAGNFRGFEDARGYVHTLGLKSMKEWWAWSTSGARPHDIPSAPDRTYKSAGWLSYPDFLGYDVGKVAGEYRSFDDARAYVHTLGLKSSTEWRAWSASGARPRDIPGNPDQKYKSAGWVSYPDFLGYEERVGPRMHFRSFEDARAYARTVGLKSAKGVACVECVRREASRHSKQS
ncbi:methyltransferase domain-containing protein [Pycnococcus provasolii]